MPDYLSKQNTRGETALHAATNKRHAEVFYKMEAITPGLPFLFITNIYVRINSLQNCHNVRYMQKVSVSNETYQMKRHITTGTNMCLSLIRDPISPYSVRVIFEASDFVNLKSSHSP